MRMWRLGEFGNGGVGGGDALSIRCPGRKGEVYFIRERSRRTTIPEQGDSYWVRKSNSDGDHGFGGGSDRKQYSLLLDSTFVIKINASFPGNLRELATPGDYKERRSFVKFVAASKSASSSRKQAFRGDRRGGGEEVEGGGKTS